MSASLDTSFDSDVATVASSSSSVCAFALVADKGQVERQGHLPWSELHTIVAQTQRVVLLLAASDVTLLHMAVPPLSPEKLKAALPHLVEDQLIADPATCVIATGARVDGMRAIAVVQRAWLEDLANDFLAMGAKNIKALPAQLCLPLDDTGSATAAILQRGISQDISVRLAAHVGLGVTVASESAPEALTMLRMLVPSGACNVYVAAEYLDAYTALLAYKNAADTAEDGPYAGISVQQDIWENWIAGAKVCDVNLMTGLDAHASEQPMNWRPWRWSLALASAILLLNVAAINSEWWIMRSEAAQLKSSMLKNYRNAYPKDTVIVDPLIQARQKIALSQQASGAAMPGDFIGLAAQLNMALNSAGLNPQKTLVSSLEYRDHSVFVRFSSEAQNVGFADKLKAALASNQLILSQAPTDGIWKINAAGVNK